jgi:diguanylate cyclase (GGDEF)-like protein
VIAAAEACSDYSGQADALAAWADLARHGGTAAQALAAEQERLAVARAHALTRHEADALAAIGSLDIASGDLDGATTSLELAKPIYEKLRLMPELAEVHSEASRLERRRGDYLAALRVELLGLDLRRRLDPPPKLSRSLLTLAVLYEHIELFDVSRRYYAEALAEAERNGNESDVADSLNSFAGFLNDFGRSDAEPALVMAERALAIQRRLSDPPRVGSCLLQVGRASFNLGRLEAAETAFREADSIALEFGAAALHAHVQFRWGELELARGHAKNALAMIETARDEYARQGNRHRLIKVYGVLEGVQEKLGAPLEAARAGREHFRLRNELLGANATGKLGELLTHFALSEEKLRNERLERENALNALKIVADRRERLALSAIAVAVALALAFLGWRHFSVRRLNHVLSDQNARIQAQGAELTAANEQLREQSERLLELSLTDPLTGLRNRAHGMERFGHVLAHSRERGERPALMLIDADNFKSINDRYGHQAGDQVLVAIASTLESALPPGAELARIGGEEFMVLVHDADRAQALLLADALRRRVAALRIDVGPQALVVTISIGVCLCDQLADRSQRAAFAEADRALYEAKRGGRDCVRIGAETAISA